MKATINFPERNQAENFAKCWSRFTKTGHTISAGLKNVSVTVYNVGDNEKNFIDTYISKLNK